MATSRKRPQRGRKGARRSSARGRTTKRRRSRKPVLKRPLVRAALLLGLVLCLAGLIGLAYLHWEVTRAFEGRLWAEPAHIWSAEALLYPGVELVREEVETRLERSGYRQVDRRPEAAGEWRRRRESTEVRLRGFRAGDLRLEERSARLLWSSSGVLERLEDLESGRSLPTLTLEPEEIGTLFGPAREDRTILPLEAFPTSLVYAVLAAEDARFYEHQGVSLRAMARAAWSNLIGDGSMQGGSTLTQQTVKNLWLTPERTLVRKMREAVMALILELSQEKDRILEVYLNEIYLGQRGSVAVCGFGEASRFYFGKDVRTLDLSESATLAAMISSPGRYNPLAHPEVATRRRDRLLDRLLELEWIDQAEHAEAIARPLETASGSRRFAGAPYFVDLVNRELRARYEEEALTTTGLQVRTTLDVRLQSAAEAAVHAGLQDRERDLGIDPESDELPLEAALVVTRPQTGEILALVGGRDFLTAPFNRAVQARRQPGSLFKPFVYLAGFETGALGPSSMLLDEPLTLTSGGEPWSPTNFDRAFRGPVTAREALERSINVPTVRAAIEAGLEEVAETAEACGLEGPLRPLPSLALGAQEQTPLSLAQAYGTLVNHGQRVPLTAIRQVADSEGELLESRPLEIEPAVSPQAAALVLDILEGVTWRGTGRGIRSRGLTGTVAAKTGTSNEGRDTWFVGITPEMLVLVWVGYDDNRPTGMTGARGALPLFVEFARRAGTGSSNLAFPLPPGVERVEICPSTGGLARKRCPERETAAVLSDRVPPRCLEHAPEGILWRLFGKDPS